MADRDDIDTVVLHWANTAKHAFQEVHERDTEFQSLLQAAEADPQADRARLMNASFGVARNAATAIVFSVLTLEAFINYYAVTRLGQDYAERYVDRLELVAKWVVVPQLVLGVRVLDEGPALQNLKRLVTLRNSIAHPKARPMGGKRLDRGLTAHPVSAASGLREGAFLAAECLVDLSDLMVSADPESDASFMCMSFEEGP